MTSTAHTIPHETSPRPLGKAAFRKARLLAAFGGKCQLCGHDLTPGQDKISEIILPDSITGPAGIVPACGGCATRLGLAKHHKTDPRDMFGRYFLGNIPRTAIAGTFVLPLPRTPLPVLAAIANPARPLPPFSFVYWCERGDSQHAAALFDGVEYPVMLGEPTAT